MAENSEKDPVETGRKLVQILDDLLDDETWDASLFLKTTKKRFVELRDETKTLVDDLEEKSDTNIDSETHEIQVQPGYVKVYIFLYQADGNNLQLWKKLFRSIVQHSLTRPVYKNEEHIRELIRSKPESQRLGYAVVAIKESDILHLDKPPIDRFGHSLLTLKEGAVQLENILEFVHANKKRYIYKNNTLTLIAGKS